MKAKWWQPREFFGRADPTRSQKWYLYIENASGHIVYMPSTKTWRANLPGPERPIRGRGMVKTWETVHESNDLFAAIGWFLTPDQDPIEDNCQEAALMSNR